MVYLLDSASKKGKCKKLTSPWKSPAVVVKKISASLYRVKLRKSMFVTNHDRLKRCRDRMVLTWIEKWLSNPTHEDEEGGKDNTTYCKCKKTMAGQIYDTV